MYKNDIQKFITITLCALCTRITNQNFWFRTRARLLGARIESRLFILSIWSLAHGVIIEFSLKIRLLGLMGQILKIIRKIKFALIWKIFFVQSLSRSQIFNYRLGVMVRYYVCSKSSQACLRNKNFPNLKRVSKE